MSWRSQSWHQLWEELTTIQLLLPVRTSDSDDDTWNTYLFVSSWVGLPVALHLPESQVGAIRQATEEGTRGPFWKSLIRLLFHTGVFTAACTELQRTCLQLIVKLKSIDREIALSCTDKKNASTLRCPFHMTKEIIHWKYKEWYLTGWHRTRSAFDRDPFLTTAALFSTTLIIAIMHTFINSMYDCWSTEPTQLNVSLQF